MLEDSAEGIWRNRSSSRTISLSMVLTPVTSSKYTPFSAVSKITPWPVGVMTFEYDARTYLNNAPVKKLGVNRQSRYRTR